MTGSKYNKRFDEDYKREIVRLVDELGKSPTQVAKDIGVTPQTIRTWVRKFGKDGSDAHSPAKAGYTQPMKSFGR